MACHGIWLEGQPVPRQGVAHRLAGGGRNARQHQVLIRSGAQRPVPILPRHHRQPFELVPGEASNRHAHADGPEILLFLLEPANKVFVPRWPGRCLGKALEFVAQTLLDLDQHLVRAEPFDEIAKAHLIAVMALP